MRRLLFLVPTLALLTSITARAEIRKIDLNIYGMD